MRILLVLLSFLVYSEILSQNKIIFLQIDTVVYQNKVSEQELYLTIYDKFHPFFYKQITFKEIKQSNTYPNYSNIIELNPDSSEIKIPIDENGSHICLKNIQEILNDTIHINLLIIYETRPIDSTFTNIYSYKILKGELDEKPYKIKRKTENSSDFKQQPPPSIIKMIINEKVYNVKMNQIGELTEVMHAHGYNKRKPFKKNSDYKNRLIKYYTEKLTFTYVWKGEIDFSNK